LKRRAPRAPKGVIDLPRTRRALAELDRLAAEHPQAFRLTGQEWIEALKKDESMAVSKVVPVRLSDAVIERIAAHAARLRELTGLEPSRSDVVRLLVERGLASVEAATVELDKHKPRKR
jgi:hypothetical protein